MFAHGRGLLWGVSGSVLVADCATLVEKFEDGERTAWMDDTALVPARERQRVLPGEAPSAHARVCRVRARERAVL